MNPPDLCLLMLMGLLCCSAAHGHARRGAHSDQAGHPHRQRCQQCHSLARQQWSLDALCALVGLWLLRLQAHSSSHYGALGW